MPGFKARDQEDFELEPGMERFRIEIGHRHHVLPGNIVGAIAGESGLNSKFIGRIKIYQEYSTVDLPEGMPDHVLELLKRAWISGRQLNISRVTPGDDRAEDQASARTPDADRPPRNAEGWTDAVPKDQKPRRRSAAEDTRETDRRPRSRRDEHETKRAPRQSPGAREPLMGRSHSDRPPRFTREEKRPEGSRTRPSERPSSRRDQRAGTGNKPPRRPTR